jgi:hypothetical protein
LGMTYMENAGLQADRWHVCRMENTQVWDEVE